MNVPTIDKQTMNKTSMPSGDFASSDISTTSLRYSIVLTDPKDIWFEFFLENVPERDSGGSYQTDPELLIN